MKGSCYTGSLPSVPFSSPSKSKSIVSIWDNKTAPDSRPPATPPEMKRRSFSRISNATISESAKVGVQIGKTKVFLRHKAFESLERLRSQEQSRAAVKLNSIFRMYLARVAYVHVRNAVRMSMLDLQAFQNEPGQNLHWLSSPCARVSVFAIMIACARESLRERGRESREEEREEGYCDCVCM